jgi:hypothetical protein
MPLMHPSTAGVGWNLSHVVYDDGKEGIAVAMFTRYEGEIALGFRWLFNGKVNEIAGKRWPVPYFGMSSDWILLPHDFSVAIAKVLIEKHAAGLALDPNGFQVMMQYLKRGEDILPFIGF